MLERKDKKFSWKKFLFRSFVFSVVLYTGICVAMYFLQEKLLFFPQPLKQHHAQFLKENCPLAEEISFTMADGTVVSGWMLKDSAVGKRPTLFYYGGNAEEISYIATQKNEFPGCNRVFVNYRGYGKSEGKPSEEKFFSDALEVYDAVVKRADVDADNTFAVGRSIGTGVATYLSHERKTRATVLITPYDNIASVAQENYPWLPVKLLLKHKFDSEMRAKEISTPMLCLIAAEDEVIPPAHAEHLAAVWKGEVRKKIFPGRSHNSIQKAADYYEGMRNFVQALIVTDSVNGK